MRASGRAALRADHHGDRLRDALIAALVAAGFRGLLLRDRHTARKRSGRAADRLQQLAQPLPAGVLGRLAATRDEVAVGAALRAQPRAVLAAADHDRQRKDGAVRRPAGDVEQLALEVRRRLLVLDLDDVGLVLPCAHLDQLARVLEAALAR